MFDIAGDRIHYMEALKPDIGYTFDFAFGMTYSLDLEALLSVPVALGLLGDNDDTSMDNPFYLLEALSKSSDKLAIVCNAGCISLPTKIQSVYSLLENSVFQVKLQNKKNFHPKLWFVKYTNENNESYIKVLILSRNLTFDKSIDLCVEMQGTINKEVSTHNQPLIDMLDYTLKYVDNKEKQNKIQQLITDIKHVNFTIESPFESYEFLPIGISNYTKESISLFTPKRNTIIVSPFLSESTLKELTLGAKLKTLITRKSSITKGIYDMFTQDDTQSIYVVKEAMLDNEYQVKQDIHAKLYYETTNTGNYLYIGSANASYNAFNNNIEFLIKLKYKNYQISYKSFLQDLIPEDSAPFEKVTTLPQLDPIDTNQNEIDKLLKEAVYAIKSASVTKVNETYQVNVKSKQLKTDKTIYIAPIQNRNIQQPLTSNNQFDNMLLKDLSQFYILAVENKKIVIKIKTSGIPTTQRDNAIYKNIINTKSKFLTYLSFLLSDDYTLPIDTIEHLEKQYGISNNQPYMEEGLYEKMLTMVYKDPQKLKEINKLIKRLEEDVISEEFLQMYTTFKNATKGMIKYDT